MGGRVIRVSQFKLKKSLILSIKCNILDLSLIKIKDVYMIIISNSKFTLYKENRVEIYSALLANRLNELLSYYPEYRFSSKVKEEPVFKFKESQRVKVLAILGVSNEVK